MKLAVPLAILFSLFLLLECKKVNEETIVVDTVEMSADMNTDTPKDLP